MLVEFQNDNLLSPRDTAPSIYSRILIIIRTASRFSSGRSLASNTISSLMAPLGSQSKHKNIENSCKHLVMPHGVRFPIEQLEGGRGGYGPPWIGQVTAPGIDYQHWTRMRPHFSSVNFQKRYSNERQLGTPTPTVTCYILQSRSAPAQQNSPRTPMSLCISRRHHVVKTIIGQFVTAAIFVCGSWCGSHDTCP